MQLIFFFKIKLTELFLQNRIKLLFFIIIKGVGIMSQAARGCVQAVAGYAHDMGAVFAHLARGAASAASSAVSTRSTPFVQLAPSPSAPPGEEDVVVEYGKDGFLLQDTDPEMGGEEPQPPLRQNSVVPDSSNPIGDVETPLLGARRSTNPVRQACVVVKKHRCVSAAVVLGVIGLVVGLAVGLTVKPVVPPAPEVCSLQGVVVVSGCAGAEISLFPGMNATQACGAGNSLITVISDVAGRVTLDAAKYVFSGNGQPFQISTAADPSAATVFLSQAGNITATLAKAGAQLAVDVVASACRT
jgi:hypothetical protein